MLEIRPLTAENFPEFVTLLLERGECPMDFYKWKYLESIAVFAPNGFIVYDDKKPVGCIGIINRLSTSRPVKDTTWFADWFVSAGGRGKGVGQLLMKEVRSLAPLNIGIVGPVAARKVCGSAGYSPRDEFFEYVTYLRPFHCGYHRFAGGIVRRFARGIRSTLRNKPWGLSAGPNSLNNGVQRASMTKGMIPVALWSSYASKSEMTLQRDANFLNWVQRMPTDPKNNREWWHIDTPDYFGCGFTETDYWGLRKAKILDLIIKNNQRTFENALVDLMSLLKKQQYDWVTWCYARLSDQKFIHYKTALPLFVANETGSDDALYLSALDKESSWREFLLN